MARRWGAFSAVLMALALLVSCFLPDRFNAVITIDESGEATLVYDGDLIFVLGLPDAKKGGSGADAEFIEMAGRMAATPGFRRADYQGNARFNVSYQKSEPLQERISFPPEDMAGGEKSTLFRLERNDTNIVTLSVARLADGDLKQIQQFGLRPQGKLTVVTDRRVLYHNADQASAGTYSWTIDGLTEEPSLTLDMAAEAGEAEAIAEVASDTISCLERADCQEALTQLEAAFEGLNDALDYKINGDLDDVGDAFFAVYSTDRARWLADIAGAPLAAASTAFDLLKPGSHLAAVDVVEIADKVCREGVEALFPNSAMAALDLLARALGLHQAGEDLARGVFGPAYIERLRQMYQVAADAGESGFKSTLLAHIKEADDVSLIPILPPRQARERGVKRVVTNPFDIRDHLAEAATSLIERARSGGAHSSELQSIIADIERVTTAIKQSRHDALAIVPSGRTAEQQVSIGTIAAYRRLHGELLENYPSREIVQAQLKAYQAGLDFIDVTLSFEFLGRIRELQHVVSAQSKHAKIVEVANGLCIPGAARQPLRTVVTELPQSMLLTLSDELAMTWLLAEAAIEDAAARLQSLDSRTIIANGPPNEETGAQAGEAVADRVALDDGSTIIGAIRPSALPFASSILTTEIASDEISSFTDGLLTLRDGSALRGAFGEGFLVMEARGRPIEIPLASIVSIERKDGSPLAVEPGPTGGQGTLAGTVIDNFEKPLEGAKVRILGSAFETTTKPDGTYALPYVPGALQLLIEHDGHDPENFSLELAQASNYPVETKRLLQRPPSNDIFYWGVDAWHHLEPCTTYQVEKDHGVFSQDGSTVYAVRGHPTRIITDELSYFIDMSGARRGTIFPVQDDGVVLRFDRKGGWSGFMNQPNLMDMVETGVPAGRKELLKMSAEPAVGEAGNGRRVLYKDFEPGTYAFIALPPREDSKCYIFEIITTEMVQEEDEKRVSLADRFQTLELDFKDRLAQLRVNDDEAAWQTVASMASEIATIAADELGPEVPFDPNAELKDRASTFAMTAVERSDWAKGRVWAVRGLTLAPDDQTLISLRDNSIYEEAALLAKEAAGAEQWQEAIKQADAALAVRPQSSQITSLRNWAAFESSWEEALRALAYDRPTDAWPLASSALSLRDHHHGFNYDEADLAEQDRQVVEIAASAAIALADQLSEQPAPTSGSIDWAVSALMRAGGEGALSSDLETAANKIAALIERPGFYAGSQFRQTRHFSAHNGQGAEIVKIYSAPDGKTFYSSARYDQALREFAFDDPDHQRVIGKGGVIVSIDHRENIAFHQGKYGFGGYPLNILSPRSGTPQKLADHGAGFQGAAGLADGSLVTLSSGGAGVSLTTWRNGQKVNELGRDSGFCCAMALSRDKGSLAIVKNRSELLIYDVTKGARFSNAKLSIPIDNVNHGLSIVFAKDGQRIALIDSKGARIWQLPSGKRIYQTEWEGPLAFDPTLSTLIYYGPINDDAQSALRFWHIDSATLLASVSVGEQTRWPTAITLLEDVNRLALGFNDGTIELYAAEPPKLGQETVAAVDISSADAGATNEVGDLIAECDRLAASGDDPHAIAMPVSVQDLDIVSAFEACRAAITHDPGNDRIKYQYARVLYVAEAAEEARNYLEELSAEGYAAATRMLGNAHLEQHAGFQDPARAVQMFEALAEDGYDHALANLAYIYLTGTGVKKDLARGRKLAEQAQDRNVPDGEALLGWTYLYGHGVPQDYGAAYSWFEKAAKQRDGGWHGYAKGMLGWLHQHGQGVPQDSRKAIEYYMAAAADGYEAALQELAKLDATAQAKAQSRFDGNASERKAAQAQVQAALNSSK